MLLDRVRGRWFAAAVEHADGWRGCLNRCLVVVLLAGIGGLSALASASPPDSVGLPGIYDHADYDDVAVLLTDTASLGNSPLVAVKAVRLFLGRASSRFAPASLDVSLLGFHLRSPPSA
jgi:hypothetical protein